MHFTLIRDKLFIIGDYFHAVLKSFTAIRNYFDGNRNFLC